MKKIIIFLAMQFTVFQHLTKTEKLGINNKFGRILSLVDFGNVDYWYENDKFGPNKEALKDNEKLNIEINKLHDFCKLFSQKAKFYYGLDGKKPRSIHIIKLARESFGKSNVHSKNIQYVRHYLSELEKQSNTRSITYDINGEYVKIPKCNFDVEICVDAVNLLDSYDALCLFSSDADFAGLLRFLKGKNKKTILIKGGYALHDLVAQADLVINAQDIKQELVFIKQKSRQ